MGKTSGTSGFFRRLRVQISPFFGFGLLGMRHKLRPLHNRDTTSRQPHRHGTHSDAAPTLCGGRAVILDFGNEQCRHSTPFTRRVSGVGAHLLPRAGDLGVAAQLGRAGFFPRAGFPVCSGGGEGYTVQKCFRTWEGVYQPTHPPSGGAGGGAQGTRFWGPILDPNFFLAFARKQPKKLKTKKNNRNRKQTSRKQWKIHSVRPPTLRGGPPDKDNICLCRNKDEQCLCFESMHRYQRFFFFKFGDPGRENKKRYAILQKKSKQKQKQKIAFVFLFAHLFENVRCELLYTS